MRTKSIRLALIAPLFLAGCVAIQPGKPVAANKAATAAWPWPDSMDAVNAAPKNHKVLYEDDKVRILEVTVEPGEKENMHYHRWPSALIVDSPAKKKEYTLRRESHDHGQAVCGHASADRRSHGADATARD